MVRQPRSGERASAEWARGVARELAALRLQVCAPLRLKRTPAGTTISIGGQAAAGAAGAAGCWDVSALAEDSISLVRCHFMRGPIAVLSAAPVLSAVLSGSGEVVVAAKVDTADNSVALVAGGRGVGYEDEVTEASRYVVVPLYILWREGDEGGWAIRADLRNMPQLGVMV